MKSILEEFANDNILPGSRYFKQNSEYGKAIKKAFDLEDTLCGLLNENERKLLDEFSSAQAEVSRLSSMDKFIYGYRLGVQLRSVKMQERIVIPHSNPCSYIHILHRLYLTQHYIQ